MLNKLTIMGRLTKDPEMRYTQNQTPVATFTIACDRDFKDADGKALTDFIDCVAWGKTAEFVVKYFHKGDMAVPDGRLQLRDWVDKNDIKRRNAELVVANIYFTGGKKSGTAPADEYEEMPDDGELPF